MTTLNYLDKRNVADFLGASKALTQDKRGLVYAIDINRSTEQNLYASTAECQNWFEIPVAAVESVMPIQPGCRGDLTRPLCMVWFKPAFDGLPPVIARAANLGHPAGLASKAALRSATAELALAPVTLTWDPIRVGDCEMDGATLTFNPDGSGRFTSTVLTYHTHSGDYWHITFAIKNAPGAVLFTLGEWTGPRMDDGNPPPRYPFDVSFAYNQTFLPAIATAIASSSC